MYPANDTVATLTPGRTKVHARARRLERLATMAPANRAPDSSPRQAADVWQHPARRFWRRRLLVRLATEAPGLLPLFVLRYLLPEAVLVHKSELDHELPPLVEQPVYVTFSGHATDGALRAGYTGLKDRLVAQVEADRGTDLAGKLWGALSEMPSYLDLGTADTGNGRVAGTPRYQARYPKDCGGDLVHEAPLISSLALTPKERWLLQQLRDDLAQGRRVLLFVRHTRGSGLPARLQRLIARDLGETAVFLDAEKVGTEKRQAWINAEVVARGRRILIVNPNAVKTGLNNLVFASTAIWHELDHSAITYRQANGRLHRIGQTQEVRIYYPVVQDTARRWRATSWPPKSRPAGRPMGWKCAARCSRWALLTTRRTRSHWPCRWGKASISGSAVATARHAAQPRSSRAR